VASNRQASEEQAAAWLQKRDAEGWSAADQAQLSRWLEADTHHRVAFLRLEAAWAEMNRLQAIGAGHPRGKVPSPEELDGLSPRAAPLAESEQLGGLHIARGTERDGELGAQRWGVPQAGGTSGESFSWRRRAALAAGLIAVLAVGAYFATRSSLADRQTVRVDDYSTPIGALASVPLKDGSTITLSSATSVRVRLGDQQRQVELARGEAFFAVAKDPKRPFVVDAGKYRVVAVGTKFAVRSGGADFRVVVTDGIVRVDSTATAGGAAQLLPAGSVAQATGAAQIAAQTGSVAAAEALLSWRSGYIVFHETALADAVAEFNRYNQRKIVIEDPQIATIRLTGKFRSTNIDSFSRLLQMSFPVRVKEAPGGIVLSAS
jgi:transmembrane sensor